MVKMADIDLPLDEIIHKKKITLKRSRPVPLTNSKSAAPKPLMRTIVNPPKHSTGKKQISSSGTDARNRIIQRKRQQFPDAREQLAKIAKTSDARSRIGVKKSTTSSKGGIPALLKELENTKPVDMRQKLNLKRNSSSQQVKKSVNNVREAKQTQQSLNKGQTRMQGTALVRTVAGRSSVAAKPVVRRSGSGVSGNIIQEFHRSHPVRSSGTVVTSSRQPVQVRRRAVQSTVDGPVYTSRPRVVQQQTVYRQVPIETYEAEEEFMEPEYETVYTTQQPTIIYEDEPYIEYEGEYIEQEPVYYEERAPSPVYHEQQYSSRPTYTARQPVQQQQYVSSGPVMQPVTRYAPAQPTYVSRPVSRQPSQYQQRQQVVQRVPSQRSQQPQRVQQVQRMQPHQQQQQRSQQQVVQKPQQRRQSAPKIVGYKVVVSNLQPIATLEDIKELFGNIGPLSSCKMSRPGSAVVVFNSLSSANKSVDVYHNRKLDGQPMQVKIVGSVTDTGAVVPLQQQSPQQSRNTRVRSAY